MEELNLLIIESSETSTTCRVYIAREIPVSVDLQCIRISKHLQEQSNDIYITLLARLCALFRERHSLDEERS